MRRTWLFVLSACAILLRFGGNFDFRVAFSGARHEQLRLGSTALNAWKKGAEKISEKDHVVALSEDLLTCRALSGLPTFLKEWTVKTCVYEVADVISTGAPTLRTAVMNGLGKNTAKDAIMDALAADLRERVQVSTLNKKQRAELLKEIVNILLRNGKKDSAIVNTIRNRGKDVVALETNVSSAMVKELRSEQGRKKVSRKISKENLLAPVVLYPFMDALNKVVNRTVPIGAVEWAVQSGQQSDAAEYLAGFVAPEVVVEDKWMSDDDKVQFSKTGVRRWLLLFTSRMRDEKQKLRKPVPKPESRWKGILPRKSDKSEVSAAASKGKDPLAGIVGVGGSGGNREPPSSGGGGSRGGSGEPPKSGDESESGSKKRSDVIGFLAVISFFGFIMFAIAAPVYLIRKLIIKLSQAQQAISHRGVSRAPSRSTKTTLGELLVLLLVVAFFSLETLTSWAQRVLEMLSPTAENGGEVARFLEKAYHFEHVDASGGSPLSVSGRCLPIIAVSVITLVIVLIVATTLVQDAHLSAAYTPRNFSQFGAALYTPRFRNRVPDRPKEEKKGERLSSNPIVQTPRTTRMGSKRTQLGQK